MTITAFEAVPDGYQQQLAARISDAEHLPLNAYGVQPNWITDDGVSVVAIHTAGTGYSVDDVLTITQASASGATCKVLVAPGGAVAVIELLTPGLGYSVANELATTVAPSGGTGCKLNITAVAERTVVESWDITRDTDDEGDRVIEAASVDSAYYKVEINSAAKEPEDISTIVWV